MYVSKLSIRNLRCFEEAVLELQHPERKAEEAPPLPNVNLLLGNNGAGKTSVLRAVALAALAPVIAHTGFLSYRLVRRTGPKDVSTKQATVVAELLLHGQDLKRSWKERRSESASMGLKILRAGDYEEPIPFTPEIGADTVDDERSFSPWRGRGGMWGALFDDDSPAFLVVGYGANRRVEDSRSFDQGSRQKLRRVRYERVASLFETQVTLTPLSFWLPRFQTENPGRYRQVVNLVNRLLPEGASFKGEFEGGEYYFGVNGASVPFNALSDGYRAYIGWVTDLLYHICMGAPSGAKLVDNRGVVLVDEIDLHLHPDWQRSVVTTLAKTLPHIQFVFTTHSPIVASSLHRQNIFVLELEGDGRSTVHQYDERIYGLTADAVLTSSYFGLTTTRPEPFVDELKALSTKAGKGSIQASLEFMERISGGGSEEPPVRDTRTRRGKSAPRKPDKRKRSSATAKRKSPGRRAK